MFKGTRGLIAIYGYLHLMSAPTTAGTRGDLPMLVVAPVPMLPVVAQAVSSPKPCRRLLLVGFLLLLAQLLPHHRQLLAHLGLRHLGVLLHDFAEVVVTEAVIGVSLLDRLLLDRLVVAIVVAGCLLSSASLPLAPLVTRSVLERPSQPRTSLCRRPPVVDTSRTHLPSRRRP